MSNKRAHATKIERKKMRSKSKIKIELIEIVLNDLFCLYNYS